LQCLQLDFDGRDDPVGIGDGVCRKHRRTGQTR
jgi:hypothetical protein